MTIQSTLKINYSPERELERVLYVLSPAKKSFYLEKAYRITLPEGITFENSETKSEDEIFAQIKKEFNSTWISEIKEKVDPLWPQIIKRLQPILKDIGYKLLPEYKLTISKYGTAGSYSFPNEIIINLEGITKSPWLKIIAHELIHLTIEPLIRKYQVEHWYKERLVDRLMLKIFPEFPSQSLPADFDKGKLDNLFDQYYPDVEKIFTNLTNQQDKKTLSWYK